MERLFRVVSLEEIFEYMNFLGVYIYIRNVYVYIYYYIYYSIIGINEYVWEIYYLILL